MEFSKMYIIFIATTVLAVLYNEVSAEPCIETLEKIGFTNATGSLNYKIKYLGMTEAEAKSISLPDEDDCRSFPDKQKPFEEFMQGKDQKPEVKNAITLRVKEESESSPVVHAYYTFLEQMAPFPRLFLNTESFCEIGICKDSVDTVSEEENFFGFNPKIFNNKFGKIDEKVALCTLKVCHESLKTNGFTGSTGTENSTILNSNSLGTPKHVEFFTEYTQYMKKRTAAEGHLLLNTFSFCVVKLCQDELEYSGFIYSSADKNFNKVATQQSDDEGRFFKEYSEEYDMYLFTHSDSYHDGATNMNYKNLTPYKDQYVDFEGVPENWCASKVCRDDLSNAGFAHESFLENYIKVFPEKDEKTIEASLSDFVKDFYALLKEYDNLKKNDPQSDKFKNFEQPDKRQYCFKKAVYKGDF